MQNLVKNGLVDRRKELKIDGGGEMRQIMNVKGGKGEENHVRFCTRNTGEY